MGPNKAVRARQWAQSGCELRIPHSACANVPAAAKCCPNGLRGPPPALAKCPTPTQLAPCQVTAFPLGINALRIQVISNQNAVRMQAGCLRSPLTRSSCKLCRAPVLWMPSGYLQSFKEDKSPQNTVECATHLFAECSSTLLPVVCLRPTASDPWPPYGLGCDYTVFCDSLSELQSESGEHNTAGPADNGRSLLQIAGYRLLQLAGLLQMPE